MKPGSDVVGRLTPWRIAGMVAAGLSVPSIYLLGAYQGHAVQPGDGGMISAYMTAGLLPAALLGLYAFHALPEKKKRAAKRRKMEEALRESEERFRTIFQLAAHDVFVKDRLRRYVYVNPAAVRDMMMPAEELIGKTDDNLFDKDLAAVFAAEDSRVLAGETVHTEHWLDLKSGRRLFSIAKTPMKDADGNVTGICGIAYDITQKKGMEQQLTMLRTQKMEAMSLLAEGIAHDFNNFLTGIAANLSLAKFYVDEGGKARALLEDAEKAAERATGLTHQLLTFSKGGAPVKRIVATADLVRESAAFAVGGSRVRCDFSIPPDIGEVLVDEGQISQVLNNLVINAVQAMPCGGVIKVDVDKVGIGPVEGSPAKGSPLQPGTYTRIRVRDQGVGIPEEHLPLIFDPYFTTKQKGSGLGLATARTIITNHQGHIDVDSVFGVGSTFTLYLPSCREAPTCPVPCCERHDQPGPQGGRVLIVDDSEMVRSVLGEILGFLGCEVEACEDGNEALAVYRRKRDEGNPFDLVIADLTIPGGMGGRDLIGHLKAVDPGVKAILTTGYSSEPGGADYEQLGFSGVLPKPFTLDRVRETLRRVM